ncbi:MAG: phage major capsid protein [Oscillospiraceae bacterium]|jgi:HK97 family phage major capsid protein|nr:phage major capsid protein [Oscillospiraceae bacterium]
MNTSLDLREKRTKIWDNAKDFLDSKRGKDGLISEEDSKTYEKMEQEVLNLGKEIDRLEKQTAIDLELSKVTSKPILNSPKFLEISKGEINREKIGRASDEYKADFGRLLRCKPLIHNAMSEGVDTDGGFLVPTEMEKQIVTDLAEYNVIRSLAKTINTSSERKIPVAATHSTATWTAENAAITESDPTFSQIMIDAFKLTDLVKVSIELLQDSAFDLETYLSNEFARAFGVAEEESFCVGTGTGQPTGIFTDNGGSIGVTANSPTAITVDNLIDLVYSLKSPYRGNSCFIMKDITVSAIRKLKDGNGAYLWQPSSQAGQPDRLLGYPLYTSPYVPALAANAYTVAFGDMTNFWIADRMGRTIARLNELYAGNGQVGFIATERVDGKVVMNEGIKLLKMAAGS